MWATIEEEMKRHFFFFFSQKIIHSIIKNNLDKWWSLLCVGYTRYQPTILLVGINNNKNNIAGLSYLRRPGGICSYKESLVIIYNVEE